jgi:5-dehydro-2-deoxygluconokinase
MKTLGYNHPLYILPFDRRGSFEPKLFGWRGALTAEQTVEIADEASKPRVIQRLGLASIAEGTPFL